FFFSSRRRHTRSKRDWSSDVCSSDLDRLTSLAAKSLGIPWVAWHMWRHILREELEVKEDEKLAEKIAAKQAEEEHSKTRLTLWVAALNEYSLPSNAGDDSLLILHALLLHDEIGSASCRRRV